VLLQTLIAALSSIFLAVPSTAFSRYFNETSDKERFFNEFQTLLIPINLLGLIIIIPFFVVFKQLPFLLFIPIYIIYIFSNITAINRQTILQQIRREKYLYVTLFERISMYAFPIIVFCLWNTLSSLVIGLMISVVCLFFFTSQFLSSYKYYYVLNKKKMLIYISYAYPIFFVSLFSWLIVFSDRYFIKYYLGTRYVGIYSVLAQVGAFASILNAVFTLHVNPIIYKLYASDKHNAIKKYIFYLKLLGILFLLVILVFLLLPKRLFLLLLEKEMVFDKYYFGTLCILFTGTVLSVFQNAMALFFTLAKKMGTLSMIWGFASVINIIGNLFIKHYGILAGAVSTAMAYFIIVVFSILWIKKNYRTSFIKECKGVDNDMVKS
jgi:O-antigen/teichoic acid export membrane protein